MAMVPFILCECLTARKYLKKNYCTVYYVFVTIQYLMHPSDVPRLFEVVAIFNTLSIQYTNLPLS